jgi:hypothetical protein
VEKLKKALQRDLAWRKLVHIRTMTRRSGTNYEKRIFANV